MLIKTRKLEPEETRSLIEKSLALYDCYEKPPVIDGAEISRAYLKEYIAFREGEIDIRYDIAGGVHGDICCQILQILSRGGLIADESYVLCGGKEITYGQFRDQARHQYAEMGSVSDDPDSDCFRGRKHLLDTFWEGCIGQTEVCPEDD